MLFGFHAAGFDETTRELLHARLFGGVSQSQFLTGLSTFGNSFPQNGSKTVPKSQNRPLGYPHIGPFVELLSLAVPSAPVSLISKRAKNRFL